MCRPSKPPDIGRIHANQPSQVIFTQSFLSKTVRGQDGADYLSCPLGVLFLLSTLLGSGGPRERTARQIAESLKLNTPDKIDDLGALQQKAKDIYGRLTSQLTTAKTEIENRNVPVVTISNGVFTRKDYKVQDNFRWSLRNDYGAMAKQLNFNNQTESLETINTWIKNETRGLIPNFLRSADELPSDTRMALFNVFTFKDEWEEPFRKFATKSEEFWINKGKSIMVQMMSGVQQVHYAKFKDEGFSIIQKPMKNDRFSLVVILPNERWNLKGADNVLNGYYLLKDLLAKTESNMVSIKLPRFKLESKLDLIPYLKSMGIVDLFSNSDADLSGITTSEQLYVSMMKQSAVLKVDEAGVEAAAVTGLAIMPLSLLIPSVEFHVDQPFVCFIYDKKLGMPLFAARVTNPLDL